MTTLAILLCFASPLPTTPPTPQLVTAPAQGLGKGLPAERRVAYRWSQVWRAALRMLRVDRGWVIEDQSEEAGFVIFQGPEGSNIHGSLELIALGEKGSGAGIRLRAQVHNGGAHAAFTLLKALDRKLREDFGPPAPPSAKKGGKEHKKKPAKGSGPSQSKGKDKGEGS